MTPVELGLVFVLGLLGSLHCLQMCGPIVLAYGLPLNRRQAVRAHLHYNAGRILTYTALGAAAGAAGNGVGLLVKMAGVRVLAGAAMVAAGVVMTLPGKSRTLVTIQKRASRRLMGPDGKFGLGLTLGFLPCGLIYAGLLKAVDAGSAIGGAATMLAFGLGTAVALLSLGFASSLAGFRLGAWSRRLSAASIMAAGVILIWRGLTGPVCHG